MLTKKQELKLLREKFLLGDITEDTYNKLRAEIESMESGDIDMDKIEAEVEAEDEDEYVDMDMEVDMDTEPPDIVDLTDEFDGPESEPNFELGLKSKKELENKAISKHKKNNGVETKEQNIKYKGSK